VLEGRAGGASLAYLTAMDGRKSSRPERRLMVTLSPNRQVVIPKRLCDELDLKAGDLLEGTLEGGRVVFTPQALIDRRVKTAIEHASARIPLSPALRAALRRT
jgi:AbrB family looped-hinge helix DNA binding protein